jgi:hypothetical protein
MTFFECFYSICHGVIHREKALEGFARHIRPMYAGANMGHPEVNPLAETRVKMEN